MITVRTLFRMLPMLVVSAHLTGCTPRTSGQPICPPVEICPDAGPQIEERCTPDAGIAYFESHRTELCPPITPIPVVLSESPAGIVTGANGRDPRVTQGLTGAELALRVSLPAGATAEINLPSGATGDNGINNIALTPGAVGAPAQLHFDVSREAVTGPRQITILNAARLPVTIIGDAFDVRPARGSGPQPQGFCDQNPNDPMCRF